MKLTMTKSDLATLLNIVVALEHKTTVNLDSDDYTLLAQFARSVDHTPDFIVRYFESKADKVAIEAGETNV